MTKKFQVPKIRKAGILSQFQTKKRKRNLKNQNQTKSLKHPMEVSKAKDPRDRKNKENQSR